MLTMKRVRAVIRSLIAAYLITGVLLLFTALLLYTAQPKESLVSAGILVIYVLASFLGGLFAGKGVESRKFFWGLVTGALYFIMLLAASWLFGGSVHADLAGLATTMLLCLGGGTLGGMFA